MEDENIEMKDRNRERYEEERRGNEQEETNLDDNRPGDESVLIIDGSNPDFTRVDDDEPSTSGIPTIPRTDGNIIHDLEQFLKKGLGVTFNKTDGPNSALIYDNLEFTGDRNNKINGALYKGKKILILKNGVVRYANAPSDRKMMSLVNEFKELVRKAEVEHERTPAPIAERRAGVNLSQNDMDNVIENVNDRIDSEIDRRFDEISSSTEITENELRELSGSLYDKEEQSEEIPIKEKLKFLKIQENHWKGESDKAKAEGKNNKALLYDSIRKATELKADKIRLKFNLKPESEEVVSMIEEEADVNDLTRLEKFKKWARENVVGVSAIAISVAGIVTAAVMGARTAIKKGGKALGKFAKGVSKVFKKLGPLFSALGTLLSKMILLGSQGLLWLSQNLWVLFLIIASIVYNEYRRKRRK